MVAQIELRSRTHLEAPLAPGRDISLSEIVSHYFPEGAYPPPDQMYAKLLLFNQLLQATGADFSIAPSVYLPLINGVTSRPTEVNSTNYETDNPEADSKSSAFHLRVKMAEGPRFDLAITKPRDELDNVRDIILKHLRQATPKGADPTIHADNLILEEIEADKFGLTHKCKVFRMTGADDQIKVRTLGGKVDTADKTPLIIVENEETLLDQDVLTLKLAVDTSSDCANVQNHSQVRILFTLAIKDKKFYADLDGIINRENEGYVPWATNAPDPYAHLSDDVLGSINNPLNIPWYEFHMLEETCAGAYYRGKPLTPEQERYGRPYYYLSLMKLGAKLIHLAMLAGERDQPLISSETISNFAGEFKKLSYKFEKEFRRIRQPDETTMYTPLQYLMYELIWSRNDLWIWDDFHEFTELMAKSARINPERFSQYCTDLGFDKIFPAVKNLRTASPDRPANFSLLPDLEPYFDHRPGREREQSDKYFMKVAMALAYYAFDKGTEPIACIIVHNGEIIAAAHNEPTEYSDIYIHAEDLAIKKARQYARKYNYRDAKFILYSTLEPCSECASIIRKYPQITDVRCAIKSAMGGETKFGLLTSDILTHQRKPYGAPPTVTLNVLEDEAREFYRDKKGWTDMVL